MSNYSNLKNLKKQNPNLIKYPHETKDVLL